MEKIIDFYEKRIKIILGIILGVCILNCIICICKDIKVSETLLGFGISIVFFFIAWAMVFIVLGFQKINPFCPKSIFKFFCYFFIIVSTIGIIFGIINDTIICLLKDKNDISLLLQVHDELILECAEAETEKVKSIVKEQMENVIKLSVPLRVSIESGKSWGDFH